MPDAPVNLAGLRALLAGRFPEKARRSDHGVPTGVPAVDDALGGGLPAGRLTELVSAAPSSGGQTVLARLLVATQAARMRVALVDGSDGFAPETVPADALRHLVWVRGRDLAAAMTAADLLVRDGNYDVLVLDLRGCARRALERHPAAAWYRLQRAAEGGTVAVLVQTPCPLVPAVPWRLVLRQPGALADGRAARDSLVARLAVERVRGHVVPSSSRLVSAEQSKGGWTRDYAAADSPPALRAEEESELAG